MNNQIQSNIMNLPFSRVVNGKETYFVEKILLGLIDEGIISMSRAIEIIREMGCPPDHPMYDIYKLRKCTLKLKLHTFRENLKGTWKPGVVAQPMFWTGRPYWSKPFYFSPKFPIVSVQRFRIYWDEGYPNVEIDDNQDGSYWRPFYLSNGVEDDTIIYGEQEMKQLAQNDGFDSIDDFFAWFNKSKDYTLIHWTDLKY